MKTQDKKDAFVLELKNYEHVLSDPDRNDTFTVRITKNIQLERGKFVSILGDSGCGKTTLLTLIGLLRSPDSKIAKSDSHGDEPCFVINLINDKGEQESVDVFKFWHERKNSQLELIRRKYIGFALQSGELLTAFNVRENIEVPLHLNGVTGKKATDRVDYLLRAFDLQTADKRKDLGNSLIKKLSGGEFQRVVLARSISHFPQLILIDEPTSALNRELAIKALIQFNEMRKPKEETKGYMPTIIMITHDRELAYDFSDVIIEMGPDGNSGYIKNIVEQTPPDKDFIVQKETLRKQREAQYGQNNANASDASNAQMTDNQSVKQ